MDEFIKNHLESVVIWGLISSFFIVSFAAIFCFYRSLQPKKRGEQDANKVPYS